ncbi:hypothetical protein AGR1C_Lc10047 [Agrobacterium fabacearum TT111]|nr:hypothetical protein AGR1C_Lc10047 [Agrobacterium fabacearum TT111]
MLLPALKRLSLRIPFLEVGVGEMRRYATKIILSFRTVCLSFATDRNVKDGVSSRLAASG